jgi:hypothetical protein
MIYLVDENFEKIYLVVNGVEAVCKIYVTNVRYGAKNVRFESKRVWFEPRKSTKKGMKKT